MKKGCFGLVCVALVLLLVFPVTAADISGEVYSILEDNSDVAVIIALKSDVKITEKTSPPMLNRFRASIQSKSFDTELDGALEEKRIFRSSNGIAARVTKNGLSKLQNDPRVNYVYIDREMHAFLEESVPLINGTVAAAVNASGANTTGTGQTVCIIDTGINYTHPDFGGCSTADFTAGSCSKVIGGFDFVNNDNDPADDNGHGTHVSGIVAADGSVRGVAPDAKIVSLKALNSAGSGSTSNVVSAIEWCTYNATKYNISVISMSLGTATLFSGFCDASDPLTAAAINDAVAQNISVVVATGNDGSTTTIASPSCVKNAAAVGSTTKSDTISGFSNTNSITDLLAPGSSINSTRWSASSCLSGCTCHQSHMVCSGTSMATPHVAGAFALLRQFKKEETKVNLTPAEIENAFNHTGFNITLGSNIFSRIDVWSAIAEIDTTPPKATITSPLNGSNITNRTIALNFSFSDNVVVDSCSFTNATGHDLIISGCTNTTFIGARGLQNISVRIKDRAGNVNTTQIFFTVNLPPELTLFEPENRTYSNRTPIPLMFIASDEDLDSVWFNIDYGENVSVTGNSTFKTNHSGHVLTLYGNDTLNQVTNVSIRFSVDSNGPNVTFVAPTPNNETFNTTTSITINITLDENASAATLEIGLVNFSMNGGGTSWSVITELGQGTHVFRIHANDTLNNTAVSITRHISINTTKDESVFFNSINATNSKSNISVRILRDGIHVNMSNVSIAHNYTLEFNVSGSRVQIGNFRWLDINNTAIVNVTNDITRGNVSANFSAVGGMLNETIWVEMNRFLTVTFYPQIIFNRVHRVFFYLNGARDAPNSSRVSTQCNVNITNRPCYTIGDGNSTLYLLTFSGGAGGADVENPDLSVITPNGATHSSTTVTLNYVARDNVAISSCFFSLNGAANSTIANCENTTINGIVGSNTLIMYSNDTSGNLDKETVSFSISTSSGSASSGGGSGSGGGGGGGSRSSAASSPTAPVTPSISTKKELQKQTEEKADTSCTYSIESGIPSSFSFVTINSFESMLEYTGSCPLTLTILSDSSIDSDISIDLPKTAYLAPGETVTLTFVREGGVTERLPSVITGSAIRDLAGFAVENLRATKKVETELLVEGTVDGIVVLSQIIPLELTVFAMREAAGSLASLAVLGVIVIATGFVVLVRRRRRLML